MKIATHTPGPWCVGQYPDAHCRIYAPKETHAIARTYGPELNGIGVCRLTGQQNAADAVLIAAAPELLDVLRAIISDGIHCDVVPHLHDRAVAVIAKATGERQK